MSFRQTIQRVLHQDWFYAVILSVVSLLLRGYKYGWYDQHLEIPLLKSLIDPSLYAGDYYIESLKVNFTSFFYPILARLIRVEDIPGVFLTLFIACRYVQFFFMYKIWRHLTGDRLVAWLAVFIPTMFGFVPEFMYSVFSHQEFTMPFVFGGLYLFYRRRHLWAAAVLGLGSNFHALYCLFPLIYMLTYLLATFRGNGWKKLLGSAGVYGLCALPFILWSFSRRLLPAADIPPALQEQWQTIYQLTAPQNYIFEGYPVSHLFSHFLGWVFMARKYLLAIVLFTFNIWHNPPFRKDRQTQAACAAAFGLLFISYAFTYWWPSRLVLDLNLIRNVQFLLFFLMGYTIWAIVRLMDEQPVSRAALTGMVFSFIAFDEIIVALMTFFFMSYCIFRRVNSAGSSAPRAVRSGTRFLVFGSFMLLAVAVWNFQQRGYLLLAIYVVVFSLLAVWIKKRGAPIRGVNPNRLFITAFIIISSGFAAYYYARNFREERHAEEGFWKIQRDWVDMQKHVKANTPKDAILLVPYDMEMGGFRIFSERKVVVSYRDCGIVGFDFPLVREWLRRIQDIEAFRVRLSPGANLKQALFRGLFKYNADYIVFMNYYKPIIRSEETLEETYDNDSFSLYKVNRTRLPAFEEYRRE